MSDRIENAISLGAPVARVWQALTVPAEFSAWYGVTVDEAFVPGETIQGVVTAPGYEGVKIDINVIAKAEPSLFSFAWRLHATDTGQDHADDAGTLVEFHLVSVGVGTRLTVIETGFEALPAEAFSTHIEAWKFQLQTLTSHIGQ